MLSIYYYMNFSKCFFWGSDNLLSQDLHYCFLDIPQLLWEGNNLKFSSLDSYRHIFTTVHHAANIWYKVNYVALLVGRWFAMLSFMWVVWKERERVFEGIEIDFVNVRISLFISSFFLVHLWGPCLYRWLNVFCRGPYFCIGSLFLGIRLIYGIFLNH